MSTDSPQDRGKRRRRRPSRRRGNRQKGGNRGGGSDGRSQDYREYEEQEQSLDDGDQSEPTAEELAAWADEPSLGILEVLGGGSGFLRRRESGYIPGDDDIYVGARLINRFDLRTGDELWGEIGTPPRSGMSPPLRRLRLVNGRNPSAVKDRPDFDRLSAMHPDEQLRLECGRTIAGQTDFTNRVIDLLCPLGKGQRAMIVAPAKAGKTTVMQAIAEGISTNHPECVLYILLVDERPEEVTEMETVGFGEVIASTFDRPAERHCQAAEITLERARRRVEMGEDVVIILDSITRMARAYNTLSGGGGRTMSGGLDTNALEKPKRFLGSARRIAPDQGGGSLTIIATALVDTGSRMDQVIFEEFKGTGNSELVLSRDLADRRIYPAIDLNASATRKEELLLEPDYLDLSRALRRQLSGIGTSDAMTELIGAMKRMPTNKDLVDYYKQRA
ncbi:MAG: transcription termination factor Rho [Longimicrobiales bacterium]|nr:transcription termination factor Rho [Longimicrobiales bacterium]